MQNFLGKAGKVAKDAATIVGDKAGDAVEISKLKAKIYSEKKEITEAQQKIGAFCFEQFENGVAVDSAVGDWCNEIRDHLTLIEELEEKIQDVKDGEC